MDKIWLDTPLPEDTLAGVFAGSNSTDTVISETPENMFDLSNGAIKGFFCPGITYVTGETPPSKGISTDWHHHSGGRKEKNSW